MKLFKLSLLLVLVSFFTACSDDDDDSKATNCVQADWIGTYTGNQNCNGDDYDIVIEVEADGEDNVIISYTSLSGNLTYQSTAFNNCQLSISNTEDDLTLSLDADLNGNVLTFSESLSSMGISLSTCMTSATK